MTTTTYDDGSTITYDDYGVSSTPAPSGMLASDYSANFTPQAFNSGANSFLDVLKYGIGRVADYATVVHAPQNPQQRYAAQPVVYANGGSTLGISNGTLLLMIGAAAVFMLFKGKKG